MQRAFALLLLLCWTTLAADAAPKKIVLIAGKKSHGVGEHEYEKTMRLFKAVLDRSNVAANIRIEVYENGWPGDATWASTGTDDIAAMAHSSADAIDLLRPLETRCCRMCGAPGWIAFTAP